LTVASAGGFDSFRRSPLAAARRWWPSTASQACPGLSMDGVGLLRRSPWRRL